MPVGRALLRTWPHGDPSLYLHAVHAFAAAYHVPLLDLYRNPYGAVAPRDFFDFQHLNEAGAELVTYLLQVDLVDQGVAWFGDRGTRTLTVPITVTL
jgi:hypothetical protein